VLKILVTFAFRQEGMSFQKRLTQPIARSGICLGRLDSQEVAVCWLGAGLRDVDLFKSILSDQRPELVINSGFAGAIRTLLEPGDFVLAENFSSPDLLQRLKTSSLFEARGRFLCVDTVIDSATKTRINSAENIFAVDMESARVDAVCRKLAVPLITARMISDRYDEEIPGLFLGKRIRQLPEISDAVAFASRMLALRRKLADRLQQLIQAVNQTTDFSVKPL
jgi:nucleoside phosphorylase